MNPRCAMSDELFRLAVMRSLERFLRQAAVASTDPAPEIPAPTTARIETKSGGKKNA